MPKTKVPALPEPSTVQDPHLRRVISSIKEAVEIRLGRRGDPMDQAVTFRDLQEAGMIKRKAGVKSGDNPVPFEPDTEATVGATIERISNEIENSWLFARLDQRIELLGFSIDDVRSFLSDTKARVETVVEQTEGQFENVASQITTVATQFDDKLSFVQNDITSLTSRYEAMASQVTLVAAVADSKNKVYRQSSQPGSANTGDVWIRSSDNRYFYFDGRRWIETGDNRIGQNSAAIQTEQTARATADQALANQITTVQATLNGQLASVRRDINVTMDNVTGLRASYVLTTDVNGYVSGFGTYNDGKTSDFAVSADRFWIAPPNSWGKVKPFIVQNGRVYIDEARIRNAAIDTAHIKHAAVDTLQVAGQAITVPSGAYYSNKVLVHDRRTNNHGTFDYAEVGSSYKLASAYVNSAGGRAFVNFTGWMRLADRTVYDSEGVNYFYSAGITLQLRRGSTIVQQMRLNTAPATRVESPWVTSSLVWIDEYPGSITHEYSVWAVDPRRGAYFDARSITVIGLKR